MVASDGVSTRGEGSADLTGCGLNGGGLANHRRMYQAKEALNNVVATFGEVEFSLWRYRQITGGQTCTTDASCPDTPGGLSALTCEDHDANAATSNVCALDADIFDNATAAGVEGQCARFTYTGAASTFSCGNCDAAASYDRAICQMYDLDCVKSTGVSPLIRVCFGHLGDGNLHVNILKENISEADWETKIPEGIGEIFKLTVSLGGTLSGEHGVGIAKRPYMPIAMSAVNLEIMRGIKKVFDPKGILNPGKIF